MNNIPYEKSLIQLIKSVLDFTRFNKNKEDLSSVFCSELVAESYQKMGLLDDIDMGGLPSNEYTPADFSEQKDKVKLNNNYRLGKQEAFNY